MLDGKGRDGAAMAGHGDRPSPLPAAMAAEVARLVGEHVRAVAPGVLWDALGDAIAHHLSPRAVDVRLSLIVRRRYVADALAAAADCPMCRVPAGHD